MPSFMNAHQISDTEMKAIHGFTKLFETIQVPVPQPKPKEPEPPARPTKALFIKSEQWRGSAASMFDMYLAQWKFYAQDITQPELQCRTDDPLYSTSFGVDLSSDAQWYPGGDFPLDLFGENCSYKNSGDNEGKLWCGERAIDCVWVTPDQEYECDEGVFRRNQLSCPY
jgi:hypothetical protein